MPGSVAKFDAFLSHCAKAKAALRPLAERLRTDGLKVWPALPEPARVGGFDACESPSPGRAGAGGRKPHEARGVQAASILAKIDPPSLYRHDGSDAGGACRAAPPQAPREDERPERLGFACCLNGGVWGVACARSRGKAMGRMNMKTKGTLLVVIGVLTAAVFHRPAAVASAPGTTRGIIDAENLTRPAEARQLVGETGHVLVPESDGPCRWTFAEGVLTASPGWDSVITREAYRDFRMHLEFNVNDDPAAEPGMNGNSGVYIQGRYEVQILNSYGVAAADYTASDCGSLYRMKKPDQIVNRPAGEWQSFDIVFRAARFAGDKKIENARLTAYQNGQLIHDDVAIPRHTGAGKKEGPDPQPIKLQGHHNPVRFRNVWIQPLDLDETSVASEPPSGG